MELQNILCYTCTLSLFMTYFVTGTLSVFTTETGGIIDDCIITRTGEQSFYIVANAACADKDITHLNVGLLSYKVCVRVAVFDVACPCRLCCSSSKTAPVLCL